MTRTGTIAPSSPMQVSLQASGPLPDRGARCDDGQRHTLADMQPEFAFVALATWPRCLLSRRHLTVDPSLAQWAAVDVAVETTHRFVSKDAANDFTRPAHSQRRSEALSGACHLTEMGVRRTTVQYRVPRFPAIADAATTSSLGTKDGSHMGGCAGSKLRGAGTLVLSSHTRFPTLTAWYSGAPVWSRGETGRLTGRGCSVPASAYLSGEFRGLA